MLSAAGSLPLLPLAYALVHPCQPALRAVCRAAYNPDSVVYNFTTVAEAARLGRLSTGGEVLDYPRLGNCACAQE